MITALGMLSGGLDSILAVRVIQEQNICVEAITFTTPFFGPSSAENAALQLGVPLHIINFAGEHLAMLKAPKHGYGRNMNPCIDCHALMFHHAGKLMKKRGAHFLFSGEVLGERPMSQNQNSLRTVARESGFEEYIVRPLSARLLPETMPEKEGFVDRSKLLDIEGRSRKPQIQLAEQFGITFYPNPGGGCKLTDPAFSKRVKDLLEHDKNPAERDFVLLSVGRHFRLNNQVKVIVGRDEQDNGKLLSLSDTKDIILTIEDIPGPTVLLPHEADTDEINIAASICVRYSDARTSKPVRVSVFQDNRAVETVEAVSFLKEGLKDLMI